MQIGFFSFGAQWKVSRSLTAVHGGLLFVAVVTFVPAIWFGARYDLNGEFVLLDMLKALAWMTACILALMIDLVAFRILRDGGWLPGRK